MEFKKLDENSVEQTSKTTVFKVDLLREKETLEVEKEQANKRIDEKLAELNAQLDLLNEK